MNWIAWKPLCTQMDTPLGALCNLNAPTCTIINRLLRISIPKLYSKIEVNQISKLWVQLRPDVGNLVEPLGAQVHP